MIIIILVVVIPMYAQKTEHKNSTCIVILGSGNPNPAPDQSGCSIMILVDSTPYVVDFGPGLVRRAAAVSPTYGGKLKGFYIKNLKQAFLTHLHSDHTTGYPDLILTPWVMGRDEPLKVVGPEGITNMTNHIIEAFDEDIKYRIYGNEPANNMGWRVECTEITHEGIVYQDSKIKVEAFPVIHGTWPNAWGFRFTTPDKVIVISGDTKPCDKLVEYAKNADILLHEVYSKKGFDTKNEVWRTYHAEHHTSAVELGEIAAKCKPGKLVMYHTLYWGSGEEALIKEVQQNFLGEIVVGHDLDIIE